MLIDNPLHQSSLALPLVESLHLLGIVFGVGAAALVDLRLLRVARQPETIWL